MPPAIIAILNLKSFEFADFITSEFGTLQLNIGLRVSKFVKISTDFVGGRGRY
jgi:hypothetical protein